MQMIKHLLADDQHYSLNTCLGMVEQYASISGLRANFDQSEAVWIGAKGGCGKEYITDQLSLEPYRKI